jgi:hypothetical protein
VNHEDIGERFTSPLSLAPTPMVQGGKPCDKGLPL